MKVAILLSGCGVYDGSEIQEAVFTFLALDQKGYSYACFAPNKNQFHVINHTNGEVMEQERNCMVESARISRGEISDITDYDANAFDALIVIGGFGAAKNLTQWAFSGKDGEIDGGVKSSILSTLEKNKKILAMCMGPTVVAKALEGSTYKASLSVGSSEHPSPYDIKDIHNQMEALGAVCSNASKTEIMFDSKLNIISVPAYMMEASVSEIFQNISQGIDKL
ncbi:MAG: isoprenoid biosynthesis glyoxalase ElbB [Flavobacteriales bacterium]